jgi:hypothetical protein
MANRGNFVEVDPFKWPSHREHEQISHWNCFSWIVSDFPKSLTLVEARTIGMYTFKLGVLPPNLGGFHMISAWESGDSP